MESLLNYRDLVQLVLWPIGPSGPLNLELSSG
jgi:hypothetical protein